MVASSLAFFSLNQQHLLLFVLPLLTAGITAFYMFRLWFMTFAGKPRDPHVYDHAHESPRVMVGPLVVLSFFAIFCAVGGEGGPLARMILASEPSQVAPGLAAADTVSISLPGHHHIHEKHSTAGVLALLAAASGAFLSYAFYGAGWVNPAAIKTQLKGLHAFLTDKWIFDAAYDVLFVRPTHVVAAGRRGLTRRFSTRFCIRHRRLSSISRNGTASLMKRSLTDWSTWLAN